MMPILRSVAGVLLIVATFASSSLGVIAQQAARLPLDAEVPIDGVAYAADFPKPEDLIGHRIGHRHTRPEQIVRWFDAVAARSDRVKVWRHGASWQGRELVHAIVTSPNNHARLDEIRIANRALSHDAQSIADADLEDMPAVVWMGYGVHGNEASAHEAPILLLYHLAAGHGDRIDALLDRLVIVVVPNYNPDGHDRFVDWVNGNRAGAATVDDQDREHREPWPRGRTNQYLFDLNRDWLPAVHPSTRARLALWNDWHPQLQTDYHEMNGGRSYFFQPGISSRTNPLTPDRNQELTREIAKFHARALDRVGQAYFSEESFDDYYYGKGSTYPDVRGSVGILFEQGSSRGLRRATEWGELDYVTTVRNQITTSLSSLDAAAELRIELLRHQRDFYRGATDFVAAAPYKAVLVARGGQHTRAQLFAQLLQRHGIDVHELAADVDAGAAGVFEGGATYVVPLDQPEARLIRAICDPVRKFPDTEFYDVSTWTVPLAYGLRHARIDKLSDSALGARIAHVELDGGRRIATARDDRHAPAVAMRWDRAFAPRAIGRLFAVGARPRLLTSEATWRSGGAPVELPAGTIVVPLGVADADRAAISAALDTAVREDHVEVFELDSGLPVSGPAPGGPSTVALHAPRIALLAGEGTSSYDVGELWFALGERHRLPVSLVEQREIPELELSRYDVIVTTSSPRGSGADKLESFVQSGGTLVAVGAGADFAVAHGLVDGAIEGEVSPPPPPETDVPYGARRRASALERIAGAIFEISLDATHPITFGVPNPLPVFRTSTRRLRSEIRAVARYAERPVMSGFVPDSYAAALAGSPAVLAAPHGQGHVVAILDDPAFRGFFLGSERLLLNAVLFAPAL